MSLRYLSVCSGMEAATVAWHKLGWTPVGFAEIEPFPAAILKHRFPSIPNYGDLTKFREWPIEPGTVDVLVGGTPCQAFSVAGLRKGLEDPRGNLALTFLALADRIKPRWILWENVPGVLTSSGGRDFHSFLSALAELGYGFAWSVLDAQFFGVPQRRRRVFLVAHLGAWEPAAEILSLREGVRGHLEASSKKGKGASSRAKRSPRSDGGKAAAGGSDELGLGSGGDGGGVKPIVMSSGQANAGISVDKANTLTCLAETQVVGTLCATGNTWDGQDAYQNKLIPEGSGSPTAIPFQEKQEGGNV